MTVSIDAALSGFPESLRDGIRPIVLDSVGTVRSLLDRGMDPAVAVMAGMSLDLDTRARFDNALQEHAAPTRPVPESVEEVVVGGGAHAAIYCSVRTALGFPRPLVLDARARFGGTFALGVRPSFYLNSRNRPGPLGAPGSRDALNVLPAAPMQPSDIGGTEYQTDADLGLVVRCALALNSNVRTATVESVETVGNGVLVSTDRGSVLARRAIVATGTGVEQGLATAPLDGRTIIGYRTLMERMALDAFPLRDLGRVAVIGAGDGGRTVVEALAGQGPSVSQSVASLDYVNRIDWYGAADLASTRAQWISCNRSRYSGLGSLFPSSTGDNARVEPLPRARVIRTGYRSALIDGRTYDTVVVATGYQPEPLPGLDRDLLVLDLDCRQDEKGTYVVGPAANLPFDSTEDDRIGENRVGLFRLAPRTARLASRLD